MPISAAVVVVPGRSRRERSVEHDGVVRVRGRVKARLMREGQVVASCRRHVSRFPGAGVGDVVVLENGLYDPVRVVVEVDES